MFANSWLARIMLTKQSQTMIPAARRAFSRSVRPQASNTGLYVLGGLGLAGIVLTTMKGRQLSMQTSALQGQTIMSPLVQDRVGKTLGWFGYGLGATASIVYAIRNSMRLAGVSPWLILPASMAFALGTYMTDYETNFPMKVMMYTGMCGVMAVNMLPLIQMSAISVITDAALATAVSMSGFAAIAYNAPSEQFLYWGGAIGLLSGGMLAVSLLGMFTGSRNLFNIWLYGGLALSGIYTMYDTQKIIHNAKHQQRFDPINNAFEIYMDAINFFIRFLIIFNNSQKKK